MKKIFLIISSLCLFLLLKGQTPANDPHWELLWEDNFSYFDTNKWVKAEHCDHGGKPQYYEANNVDIYNGNLRIRLLEENALCSLDPPTTWVCGSCYRRTHYYTSGWINSKESFDMRYGYIEAQIQFPYGQGVWPAFWLWSSDSRYEEIDIVELFGSMLETGDNPYQGQRHNENFNTSHLHYGDNPTIHKDYIYNINDYTDWHIYGLEWSPNKILIYVDNKLVNFIENPSISDYKSIIFNLALIDPNEYDILQPYSGIPATMLVNWVKVYELNSDCTNVIWTCSYDFNLHENLVKSVINIGGSGCINSLNNGDNIVLRAKNYVQISGDFTVPLGAELYIDCNDPCY
jgi:beta-glucanase (GH16 family)